MSVWGILLAAGGGSRFGGRKQDADLGGRTLLERWWSGESGAYLVDRVPCSVLVARDLISDAEFEAHLAGEAKAD